MNSNFVKAKPVWIKDKEREVNCRVQFKTLCDKKDNIIIHIATSGVYQLYVNGRFVSYGPARAGKNHFRKEIIDISSFMTEPKNVVVIEAAGYYCDNFYIIKQDSFLQAEIISNRMVLAATGYDFTARINPYYIQKIQRYSFQRPFAEAYSYNGIDTFFIDSERGTEPLATQINKNIIERTVPYPEFKSINAKPMKTGMVEKIIPDEYKYDRYFLQVGFKEGQTTGWKADELDCALEKDWQEMKFTVDNKSVPDSIIKDSHYNIYELPHNATGILDLKIKCDKSVTLYIVFDELLTGEFVNPKRTRSCDIVRYQLEEGIHTLKTFEVYTMKYLQLIVLGGDCDVEDVSLIEYKHPKIKVPELNDKKLQLIAEAAVETYLQNAVDLFTDCPSRERAGWLCDSFFLARTEYALTGKNTVEEAFLENFLHEECYGKLPRGMVPMCYPADHPTAWFIPNWAMWLIIELADYKKRGGKASLIERYKDKIYGILNYFKKFENSDGLLENLQSWVFVEWSRANDSDMVQGVNYPTNMLYYAAMKATAELYDDSALKEKAEIIKKIISEQSFDGGFFLDRAYRTPDGIFPIPESTEVCQYYAFFCGIATPESHPELFDTLLNEFGPNRDVMRVFPEVHKAAPFIGNYLRLEILKNYGYDSMVLENIKDYFYYMAVRTGTLWEKAETTSSCNHGFASCVLYWMI